MSDRTQALLRALGTVPSDGALEPTWDAASRMGAVYRGTPSDLDNESLAADLEELAQKDYVERVFVERLSLCPTCSSHAVNVHEACISCGSSNLVQFKALLHFRCGYVGPTTSFREEPDGLRCPKCNRLLRDLGTDHDSPGEYFRCRSCASMFQTPEVGARCLSCGARFTGQAMESIAHRDVYSYRLTSLGRAAVKEQRLTGIDEAALSPALAARGAMLEQIEAARRERAEHGKRFGVIVIACGLNGTAVSPETVAQRITETIAPQQFTIGRLDSHNLVMLVPDGSKANAIRGRVAALDAMQVRAEVVEVADREPISDALEFAARSLTNG